MSNEQALDYYSSLSVYQLRNELKFLRNELEIYESDLIVAKRRKWNRSIKQCEQFIERYNADIQVINEILLSLSDNL